MDDSIADENFGYREDDIGYSGDEAEGFGTAKSRVVQNQPHDEEVALSDTESFTGRDEPPNVKDASLIESHDGDDMSPTASSGAAHHTATAIGSSSATAGQEARPGRLGTMAQEGGDADDSSHQAGHYNAAEFKHLNVSDEIKTLFQQITRFKPQTIELDTKLKPFIPDYIPSIGGIDEFIKVPRPDGKPDFLGLKVLDEPAAKQSDPTVLTLQLRQMSKEAPGSKAEMIGRIEHTDEQKQKKIGGWVQSINDIHRNKPAATVNYSRRMPDIEALMQEWPPEMEAFVRTMKMPTGDLDLDLRTFTKLVCSILDIPVYDNPVESLHLLFSLYLDFKQNPVFAQLLQDGGASGPGAQGPAAGDALGSWGGHTHSAGSTGGGSAVPWEARGPDTPGSVASGYGKPGGMPAPW